MFASKKYEENLELAQRAISYVRRTLPYGSTNKKNIPAKIKRATRKRVVAVQSGFNSTALNADKKKPSATQKKRNRVFRDKSNNSLFRHAFRAETLEAGNCGEQSFVAFNYLKKLGVYPLERFAMEGGNHAFIVIGRDPETDPRDPRTWNSDTVICDPWAGEVYSAQEFIYGFNLHGSKRYRKELLESVGFPKLQYGFYDLEKPIEHFKPTLKNTVSSMQGYEVRLIGQFQQQFKKKLSDKDFYLLEKLKDKLLRRNINSSPDLLPEIIDEFRQKAAHSPCYQDLYLLSMGLAQLVQSNSDDTAILKYKNDSHFAQDAQQLIEYKFVDHFQYLIKNVLDNIEKQFELLPFAEIDELEDLARQLANLKDSNQGADLNTLAKTITDFNEQNSDNKLLNPIAKSLLQEMELLTEVETQTKENQQKSNIVSFASAALRTTKL